MKALGRSLLKQKVNEERARTTVFKSYGRRGRRAHAGERANGPLRAISGPPLSRGVAKKIGMEF